MRILLITTLLLCSIVLADPIQSRKPVMCDNTEMVFRALFEQVGERPIWIGQGEGEDTSRTTLLVNSETKTWTLVQFDKNQACVLGAGIGGRQIFTGPVV